MNRHRHEYLVIGPFCWGRGITGEEAYKQCKVHWPGSSRPNMKKAWIYLVPVGSYVSNGGMTITYKGVPCKGCDLEGRNYYDFHKENKKDRQELETLHRQVSKAFFK